MLRLGVFLLLFGGLATSVSAAPQQAPKEASEAPVAPPDTGSNFLNKYPHLQKYLYKEPRSEFLMGIGAGPLSFVKDQALVSLNLFEIHWVLPKFQWEIFKISLGFTYGDPAVANSKQLTMRTVPKWRINDTLSLGLLVGYEFVSFKGVNSQIIKSPFVSVPVEPFSSKGMIYGLALNQDFTLESGRKVKVSQVVYEQTYPTEDAGNGWEYLILTPEVVADPELIEPGTVIMIEVSWLF